MALIDDLRAQTQNFFKQRQGVQPVKHFAAMAAPSKPRFSTFDERLMNQAMDLVDRYMAIAMSKGGDTGLEAVLQEVQKDAATTDLDMVKFALMVFITHFPGAARLSIPPLEVRAPEKVLPSKSQAMVAVPTDLEAQLSWFREDVKANEHHEHWHVVYPHSGIPDGHGHRILKQRHGELFFYMHHQMLARYDTERLAVNLPSVVPLSDYSTPIPEGNDPTPADPEFGSIPYSPRPASSHMVNVTYYGDSYTVQELATYRDNITNVINSGSFALANNTTVLVTSDLLGAAEESSIGSPNANFYGNHHGDGHIILGNITDPTGNSPGVMLDTAVAIRDPIFYRWHRHIDNFSFNLQEQQPPNDLSDAPPVLIRKGLNGSTPANQSPDIILCFKDSIPGTSHPNFNGKAYGEQTFGGANWNKDFSTSQRNGVTTDELQTMMLNRPITLYDGTTVTIHFLDQREFFYFIRIQNQVAHITDVTVRIFLVAQQFAENRRMWIEMDKFHYMLQPSQKEVIFRPAALSSVIRKPAIKPPSAVQQPLPSPDNPDATAPENYCDCGWPYNLLLPRGTKEGMGFRFMVMLTDWSKDQVADDTTCGSMSFCGAKDRYPDSRSMGYPFDKPFGNSAIAQTIAAQNNMATRGITIRLVGS